MSIIRRSVRPWSAACWRPRACAWRSCRSPTGETTCAISASWDARGCSSAYRQATWTRWSTITRPTKGCAATPYTAGGQAGFRPDYAATVYTRILKRLFPDTPVVLGGIEASLRRLTHYDYWSDSLKPSILIDSGADLLAYGMGDRVMPEIARAARNGFNMHLLKKLPQVAFVADRKYADSLGDEPLRLYPFERCLKDKRAFGENFRRIETESNRMEARTLVEETEGRFVVVNPPYPKLSEQELDRSFALPYTRLPHPRYNGKGDIPAYEMIKFSVNLHRGCFGGCSFCTISAHQGKFVSSRSERSVLDEVRAITAMPGFKGYLSDLGGPSANMYRMGGRNEALCRRCSRPSCLFPAPCRNLRNDHRPLIELYRRVDRVPGIKKSFIGSGIRYDLFEKDDWGISARGDSPPCVGTTESRSRAYRGRRAETDAQTLVRAFPNAERAIRPDMPRGGPQLPTDPLLHIEPSGMHRKGHAPPERRDPAPALPAGASAGPDPHADDSLVGDVLHGRESLHRRESLRGALPRGEAAAEKLLLRVAERPQEKIILRTCPRRKRQNRYLYPLTAQDTKMAKRYNPNENNAAAAAALTDQGALIPPQAIELEEAVLGALMLEKDAIIEIQGVLTPEAFYKEAHQTIYKAIMDLSMELKPIDLYTVSEKLRQTRKLTSVGGAS